MFRVIPQFSGIFESLRNVMEWIAEKEMSRSKVHEHTKVIADFELFTVKNEYSDFHNFIRYLVLR